jgi:hypothetical protein
VTTLGIGLNEVPKGEVAASFRGGWLRHFRVALSSAGGAAVVVGIFELLQRQPIEGFRLLGVWGPWPIVALVALTFGGRFMSRLSDSLQTAFSALVSSAQQQAQASDRQANALSKLADQGGQQAEEVRRLAIYAAQEFPSVYERFNRQDEVLANVAEAVNRLVNRG